MAKCEYAPVPLIQHIAEGEVLTENATGWGVAHAVAGGFLLSFALQATSFRARAMNMEVGLGTTPGLRLRFDTLVAVEIA